MPTAVAFLLRNRALRIPSGRSSNSAQLVPIMSLLCICDVLKEQVSIMQAIGMAIVLLSVFLNVRLAGGS